ncbi:unnamed protein product [Parajaminaea phylloscopi]
MSGANRQVLDKLKVERERGITVKSQAVSMVYDYDNRQASANVSAEAGLQRPRSARYLLNLIDTPGHVDFSYEVSRSLSACQSALLIIDATQGVQAQTIANARLARELNLPLLPILNKVDLPASDPDRCLKQLDEIGIDILDPKQEPLLISAKTGQGVDEVLKAIVERTEPLPGTEGGVIDSREGPGLRALVFDSWYDSFKGVVALVSIMDGAMRKGNHIMSAHSGKKYEVLDIGVNYPDAKSTGVLRKGQVGWVICNMKNMREAVIGDTMHLAGEKVEPLEGFRPTKPMVYASAYPVETTDFVKLEEAINRLALNDRSITVQRESSMALGQGCRLGFLGTLHAEIFRSRLSEEYGQEILVTTPTVPYRATYPDGTTRIISNPVDFPSDAERSSRTGVLLEEPVVYGTLTCPEEYTGEMMQLCSEHRGDEIDVAFSELTGQQRQVKLKYRLPMAEIVTDFFPKLKSRSSGYAAFEYEIVEGDEYQTSDLVKLSFQLSGTPVDALSMIMHRSKAVPAGRAFVKKLKDVVSRQYFEIAIQAIVAGKVVARETVKAYRRDVTAGMYGGDQRRKDKKLENQKEGRKRMRAMNVGKSSVASSGQGMAPKLGPLSGRTLRGPPSAANTSASSSSSSSKTASPGNASGGGGARHPSAAGAASGPQQASSSSSSSSPRRTASSSGAAAAGSGSSSSSPSSSRIRLNNGIGAGSSSPRARGGGGGDGVEDVVPAATTSWLLPREQETTYHRQLRTLLIEFCRSRSNWETEVYDLAETVGRYASCLGAIEDELKERAQLDQSGSPKHLAKAKRKSASASTGLFASTKPSEATLYESLGELEDSYAEVDRSRKRVIKVTQTILRIKDDVRDLGQEWLVRERAEVAWSSRIDGSEFAEAVSQLALQVQLQATELLASLQTLFTRCSPLGSLAQVAEKDAMSTASYDSVEEDGPPAGPVYDASTSSRLRTEILTRWRDLPFIERTGRASYEWWREVWRSEVGRWDEFMAPSSFAAGPR